MSLSIYEVLENANYNLQNNGMLGLAIGKDQLKNALEQLNDGKDLNDEFEDKENDTF